MVKNILTEQYMSKLKDLSVGAIDPEHASAWAEEEMLRLERMGEVLTPEQDELLDNLMLAGTINGPNKFLYTKEDFISWIIDWNNKHASDSIKSGK